MDMLAMVIFILEMFVILDVIRDTNTLEMEIRLHAHLKVGHQLGLANQVTFPFGALMKEVYVKLDFLQYQQ